LAVAETIAERADFLRATTFRIVISGPGCAGIRLGNALLQRTTHSVDDPTFSTGPLLHQHIITQVSFTTEPSLAAYITGGRTLPLSSSQYAGIDKGDDGLLALDLGYPAEMCAAGVSVIHVPEALMSVVDIAYDLGLWAGDAA